MGIQTNVAFVQGWGIPGTIADSSTVRSQPFNIVSASAAYNIFGTACSVVTDGVAQAGNPGGAFVYAGIMISPQEASSAGVVGNPLAPTLTVPNNTIVQIANLGELTVYVGTSAAIGDLVIYDQTTGVLSTITPATALPVGFSSAYAVIDRFTVTTPGLAVIRLTDTPTIPVP